MTIDPREFETLKRRVRELDRLENGLGGGAAFPASPTTGALFYRTDLGWLCYYDGTRWLTAHEGAIDSPVVTNISAAGQTGLIPVRTDYELWVTKVAQWYLVATTNNGSNYWTITLRSVNSSYGGGSAVHTFNTSARTANVWYIEDGAPSATQNPTENSGFDINLVKTAGAPGNLSIGMTVFFRLIVT